MAVTKLPKGKRSSVFLWIHVIQISTLGVTDRAPDLWISANISPSLDHVLTRSAEF